MILMILMRVSVAVMVMRILARIGGELRLAAIAAEQHLLTFVHEPMGRVRLWNHAADRIALRFGMSRRVIGMVMLVH